MKNENNQNKKERQPKNKSKKGKSTAAQVDNIQNAASRINPHTRTGLSKDLADTGTNVSYENPE